MEYQLLSSAVCMNNDRMDISWNDNKEAKPRIIKIRYSILSIKIYSS